MDEHDNDKKDTSIPINQKSTSKMRQIVIESDGNVINLVSADVSGRIELVAILENLVTYLKNQKNGS